MTEEENSVSKLEKMLKNLKPTDKLQILITSKEIMKEDNSLISRSELVNRNTLAIKGICDYLTKQKIQYVPLEALGMVGANLTVEQIQEVAKHPDVYSVIKDFGIDFLRWIEND